MEARLNKIPDNHRKVHFEKIRHWKKKKHRRVHFEKIRHWKKKNKTGCVFVQYFQAFSCILQRSGYCVFSGVFLYSAEIRIL